MRRPIPRGRVELLEPRRRWEDLVLGLLLLALAGVGVMLVASVAASVACPR